MNALLLLTITGVTALLAELFNFKKILFAIMVVGLLATIGALAMEWNKEATLIYGMMKLDHFAIAFSIAIISVAVLWFFFSEKYVREQSQVTDYYALIGFTLVGAMVMTSYTNMVMLFLGIEILSIPLYILAGSNKTNLASNEAGFKYFLMGSFATGFLLFGVALIYGSTGSFDIYKIREVVISSEQALPGIFYAGVLFILMGMAFKVSAAPFHFWAPDVYTGAPTVITAYMATIVKTAAFAAFLRLFIHCFATVSSTWDSAIGAMVILSLLVSNITAVYQSNVKRMLAYSSISHAGYMLLAILAMNASSATAILYYAVAYSIATLAAFTVFLLVSEQKQNENVDAFNGLSKNNPFLAFTMTVALLSMAGIPPVAGFFAKYYIFTDAIQAGYTWLVLVALIGSLVGVYYYFRVIIAMYFKPSENGHAVIISPIHKALLAVTIAASLLLGLFPDIIIALKLNP